MVEIVNKDNMEKLASLQKEEKEKQIVQNDNPFGFHCNDQGGVKSTSQMNVVKCLTKLKPLKKLFRFNEFTESIDVSRNQKIDLSKYGVPTIYFEKGKINDSAVNGLITYLDTIPEVSVTFKAPLIISAIDTVSKANKYNPVKDWLNECRTKWIDAGKPSKIHTTWEDFLGIENTKANHLIEELISMGVVAKAFDPTTKFDFVCDLVGGQGVGKTTFLMKLAPSPDYYTDQFNSFDNKDDYENMRNVLIVNDDEMTASNSASFEVIKKFVTMQKFSYRPPYGRYPITFGKKFVLFRTTNEIAHLKDKSGDRRFLSLLCNKDLQKKHPVKYMTREDVELFWGEVVDMYIKAKEAGVDPFDLTDSNEIMLERSRKQFISTTALEDTLTEVLDSKYSNADFIGQKDLYDKVAYEDGTGTLTPNQKQQVKHLMEHLGWSLTKPDGKPYIRRIDSKPMRGWAKKM